MISIAAGALLIYPIMTVQRRLECFSNQQGMLKRRYSGLLEGLKVVRREEGVKGLYRGFFGYCLVNSISTTVAFWTMFGMLYEPDIF